MLRLELNCPKSRKDQAEGWWWVRGGPQNFLVSSGIHTPILLPIEWFDEKAKALDVVEREWILEEIWFGGG